MTAFKFLSALRRNTATMAMGLLLPVVNAQPQPAAPMPADIVRPALKAGMDMKPGLDMKQGTNMKQGMDMKPMMMDMNDKMMAMKPTGNTDVDFAMMMRIHHQAAITMGEAELQNGTDPQMRVMARDIIRAQKKEIAAFDKFLIKRGEPDMKMNK